MKKLSSLSNFTIDSLVHRYLGDKLPFWGGVLCRDELRDKPHKKAYVINMEAAKTNGAGTHWVLLYDVSPSFCIYADSYGQNPPLDVLSWMKRSKKKIMISTALLQNVESTACGYFAIYILIQLYRGYSLQDITTRQFKDDDETNNETKLRQFFDIRL